MAEGLYESGLPPPNIAAISEDAFETVKEALGLKDYTKDAAAFGIMFGLGLTYLTFYTHAPQSFAQALGGLGQTALGETGETIPL